MFSLSKVAAERFFQLLTSAEEQALGRRYARVQNVGYLFIAKLLEAAQLNGHARFLWQAGQGFVNLGAQLTLEQSLLR